MERRDTGCVIAGGGPAGILLGYLLARAGIEVTVLEKWPDFFRDFRGDTIHPSTMDILAELGLLEAFLALPHSEMESMTFNFGSEAVMVADFRRTSAAEKFVAFIPQWDFLDFLAKEAKRYPTFHLLMETEATDVVREGGAVVGVAAKGKDGAFEIRAPLTIGADGRHSTIRERAGFPIDELGAPIDVLWFRIGMEGPDERRSLAYADDGRALVLLDRRDYWQCAYLIKKDSFPAMKEKGLEAFRESVRALAPVDPAQVSEVDSWDKVKLLSVTVDHARAWAKEGVVLIGDAAHAMSPLGGVGINYAIHDAVAAANILVPALRAGDTGLAVLERIQARRAAPTLRIQRLQVFLQNRLLAPLLDAHGHLRVPLLLRLFQWFPILRGIPARIIGFGFRPEHVRIDFRRD